MDADFSHDPAHLPALIGAAENATSCSGRATWTGGDRRLAAAAAHAQPSSARLYARTILGVKIRDLTTGFRCVRREVLEAVEPSTLRAQGYVFNIELTYRALLAGFRVTEIPICFRDRTAGDSKMSLPIAIEALMLVPKLRRLRRPRRASQGWQVPRWPSRRETLGSPGTESAGESEAEPVQAPSGS